MINSLCISETKDDPAAIRELLLTLEQGYEEKDSERYISVFSDDTYEYISDMTTPDDPSDDIHLLGTDSERRAAIRVFKAYENFDLEMTDPEIIIDGSSAEAKSEFRIIFVVLETPNIPSIYYAGGTNVFSLRRIKDQWKIVRWQQHEMAAEALAARMQEERRDKEVGELIRDLGDDRLGVWALAVSDLRKVRETAVGRLIEALHSSDKNISSRAANVLSGTQDEGAVRALIEILGDEENDVDVRVAAVNALSECAGTGFKSAFLESPGARNSDAAGSDNLSYMVDRSLFAAAKDDEPKLNASASLALARRLREKIDDVYRIVAANLQHEDDVVREAAVESLGIMVTPSSSQRGRTPPFSPFAQAFSKLDSAIREMSGANVLERRFRDRSESEDVRLAALESLKIYRQSSGPPLQSDSLLSLFRDALKDNTESVQIRSRAAHALAKTRDDSALELLVDVAKDRKEASGLRKEVIAALGAMGDSKAAKPLIGLLSSHDVELRREAAKALEQLGDRSALKPLIMVLMNRDEDIYVRRLAGGGIVKIDRDRAFGPLVQIMNDNIETAPARRMAAERIALLRDDRSVSLFVEVLKDKQQPWWLRRVAVNCLSKAGARVISTSPCIEALKAAADDADERVAEAARDALKNIPPQTSNQSLTKY